MRSIRLTEARSGLSARCRLLDDVAPQSCAFAWAIAERGLEFDAIHAMWTGPEISVPIPSPLLPADFGAAPVREENATSFPEAGELVLAYAADRSLKGLPPGDFYDIGVFYGPGGRLFMPFGWLRVKNSMIIPCYSSK